MTIEEIILNNSTEPKAKLFGPAQRAFSNPETGITVNKQGALRVIKDCAETTINFLPIEIFLTFASPVKILKGKFNKENINDLVNRSKNNKITDLLLTAILNTCPKNNISNVSKSSFNEKDPYGDYDNTTETTVILDPVEIIFQTYS